MSTQDDSLKIELFLAHGTEAKGGFRVARKRLLGNSMTTSWWRHFCRAKFIAINVQNCAL